MYLYSLIALIPIIWIFFGMLKLKLASHKAGIIALAGGAVIAATLFKMPLDYLFQAFTEGLALAVWPILWVIFAALFTYNLLEKSGAMNTIKRMLSGLSSDRRIQALLIAFGFGGFLEATAGFGTAVAIPVSILAALGFEPVFAAVVCLIANTIPVALGVVGIPIITLSKVTNLPVNDLTIYTALQLLPFVVVLPVILVAVITSGLKGIKGVLLISLASGAAFGAGQTLIAWLIGPELSAVIGSLLAMLTIIVLVKRFPVAVPWHFPGERPHEPQRVNSGVGVSEALKAWSPYIFILVIVLATQLVPSLAFLGKYPFEQKILFYKGPEGKPLAFSLLTNPGTIILVSAIIGGFIQGVRLRAMYGLAADTLKQIKKTIITVMSIVSLAKIMGYSGMISSVASALSSLTGGFFPFISPFIGALGTFITGSDTSSNVLFGELQEQTAMQIGSNILWVTAANASGATAGKMISPQSISIAIAAAGIAGAEHKILAKTMKYAFWFVLLLGVLVYLADRFILK